jgi:hypothetical protein
LAIEALLRALGYLLAAPFILAALVIQGLVAAGRWLARWIGIGASELAEASAPARSRAWGWAARAAKKCGAGVLFAFLWVLSAKDDLVAEGERDVNPFGLLVKLVIIVAVLMGAVILGIEAGRATRRA